MQSPTPAARHETPAATPCPPGPATHGTSRPADSHGHSPDSDARSPAEAAVRRAAHDIADVLSGLARQLNALDGTSLDAHGALHLALTAGERVDKYQLETVSRIEGVSVSVGVLSVPVASLSNANGAGTKEDRRNPDAHPRGDADAGASAPPNPSKRRAQRDSDAELEPDLVSRKRQRLEDGIDADIQPAGADNEDMMPLITKDDLQGIVAKLREDIQDDTTECVNHVHKLLCRFKQEWQERETPETEQTARPLTSRAHRPSIAENGASPGTSFPSAGSDADDQDISVAETIRRESKLISSQIRWLEDCRRVAADAHGKREETWRSSSASFHDQGRQDREGFQRRMLHESSMNSQTLNQILNEVKSFGLFVQSMKWETPSSLSHGPPFHHAPSMPAFPQPPPPAPAPTRGGGGGAGRGFRGA